jgi:hypothetical protein
MGKWYSELAFCRESTRLAEWSVHHYGEALELGISPDMKRNATNGKSLMMWKSTRMEDGPSRRSLYDWVVSSVKDDPNDPTSLFYYALMRILDMILNPNCRRNKDITQCRALIEASLRWSKGFSVPIPSLIHYLMPLVSVLEFEGFPQDRQLPPAFVRDAIIAMNHLDIYTEKADWRDFVSIDHHQETEPSHFQSVMNIYDQVTEWVRAGFTGLLPLGSHPANPALTDRKIFEESLKKRAEKPFLCQEIVAVNEDDPHISPVPLFL